MYILYHDNNPKALLTATTIEDIIRYLLVNNPYKKSVRMIEEERSSPVPVKFYFTSKGYLESEPEETIPAKHTKTIRLVLLPINTMFTEGGYTVEKITHVDYKT